MTTRYSHKQNLQGPLCKAALVATCLATQIYPISHEDKTLAYTALNTGYELIKKKEYAAALPYLEKSVDLDPENVDAQVVFGDLLSKNDTSEKAILHYRIADTLRPNNTAIIYRMVRAEKSSGHLTEAHTLARKLVLLEPDTVDFQVLLARICHDQRDFKNAIKIYQRVIAQYPTYTQLDYVYEWLGYAYLNNGDWQKCWHTFEHIAHNKYKPTANQPWWQQQDPTGKTLLIIEGGGFCEDPVYGYGYGDTFQALHYLKEFKKKNCTIIVQARRELIPLLSLCPYIDSLIEQGANQPRHDLQTTTGRIFQNVNTSPESIPQGIPYLYAAPSLIQFWKNFLAHDTNIKIGLCWKSNDNNRSIPLQRFSPLATIKGISLYSLQKINSECDAQEFSIIKFPEDFDKTHGRFMDTAAVMKNLDLVITIDTSIAHLAGALGTPTWLLLPYNSDWRWLHMPDTTPWYPTIRLFRQTDQDDWQSVIDLVLRELKKTTQTKTD